jgi:hypothetical protein
MKLESLYGYIQNSAHMNGKNTILTETDFRNEIGF